MNEFWDNIGGVKTYGFTFLLIDDSFVGHITFVSKNHSFNVYGGRKFVGF